VLTATQRQRLAQAMTSENQVYIITKDEANTPGTRPAGTAPMTYQWTRDGVNIAGSISARKASPARTMALA
jgi:hypothetical protein